MLLVEHFGTENIRRHQIGRELDALGVEAQRDAERLDQLGLGEAGHADQQRMTAGEDGDERVLDHPILAEDDGRDLRLSPRESGSTPARPNGRFRLPVSRHFPAIRQLLSATRPACVVRSSQSRTWALC